MLNFNLSPFRCCPDDNLTKFLFTLQTFRHADSVGELIARWSRFRTEFTTRHHHTLGTNSINDLRHGYTEMCQPVRLDPDTHGVVGGTDDIDSANTLDTGQNILDVD